MVAAHRFSWITRSGKWEKFDSQHSNVALVSSETGECIWDSWYNVDAVRSHAEFEEAGIRSAVWVFMHFDLDGLVPNVRGVACRRVDIHNKCGRVVPTSIRHCGNHVMNLVELSSLDSFDGETVFVYCFLRAAALYLRMAGVFLRLIQSVPGFMRENFVKPVGSAPDPFDKEVGLELKDYFRRNYKNQIETEGAMRGAVAMRAMVENRVRERERRLRLQRSNRPEMHAVGRTCTVNMGRFLGSS